MIKHKKVIIVPTANPFQQDFVHTIKCMENVKRIVDKTMKQKNLSYDDIKKTLGIKRFEN